MTKKIAAIIVLVMVCSLSIAGCTVGLPSTSSPTPTPTPTPTSTPTPPTDYSKYFSGRYESVSSIVVQPFTKASASNMRGNDVYRGVIRNASQPGSKSTTIVIELTKSHDEAKQLYDKTVAEETNMGYVFNSASTANWKAFEKSANVDIGEAWIGGDSAGHSILCATESDPQVGTFGTWLFITHASE